PRDLHPFPTRRSSDLAWCRRPGAPSEPGRPGRSPRNGANVLPLLQPVQQLVHLLRRELLVVVAVDHDHRRAAARGDALFLALEVDAAVGGGLSQLAAQLLLRVRDKVLRAVEPAADVGAEGDVVAADLLRL